MSREPYITERKPTGTGDPMEYDPRDGANLHRSVRAQFYYPHCCPRPYKIPARSLWLRFPKQEDTAR